MSEDLYYEERGPIIIVTDPYNPNIYQVKRNPMWGELPEICPFPTLLEWQYYEDYKNMLRDGIRKGFVPISTGITRGYFGIYNIGLDDIKFHKTYMHRINSHSFRLDVVIIADITVYYGRGKRATEQQWYRVQGKYDSFGHSNFFETINLYNMEDIPQEHPLSEYLIPYLCRADLDREAEEFLMLYYPEALESPMPVNGKILISRMGFKVMNTRLSLDDSVLARVFFEKTDITYYVNDEAKTATVPAKTILIDKTAHRNTKKNISDTLVHEGIHIHEHWLFYEGQRLFHSFLFEATPEFENLTRAKSDDEPIRWIEGQADHMTPRIRIPLRQSPIKAAELFEKYKHLPEPISYDYVIAEFAAFYDCSKQTATNRLVETGYDKARGMRKYANGMPVPGYLVESTVRYNQTYTIDFDKVVDEYDRNAEFRRLLEKGDFIYVEGHLCLNRDKYIWTNNNKPFLSTYARTHMAECCLLFTIRHDGRDYEYIPGVLNRNEKKPTALEYLYKFQDDRSVEATDAGVEILMSCPPEFNKTLIYHMDNLGVTNEKLSELSLLSERTITRMRGAKKRMPPLENIISASIGLSLYPDLTYDMLEKADRKFDPDIKEHKYFKVMIRTMYRETIQVCNQYLISKKLKPLLDDHNDNLAVASC